MTTPHQLPKNDKPRARVDVLEAAGATLRDCPHCGLTMFAHEVEEHEQGHALGVPCKVAP